MSEPQEKVPISDLKDAFLECPVCVEHFNQTDRRPRLLHSCLHAFCTQCLHQLLQKEGKGQVTCPLCRQVQKVSGGADSLPKDPVREQLVEYLQIKHRREVLCKDCPDNNTAKSRCMECGENFCQECENAHKRNRSTRSHRVVPFEEVENETNATLKIKHFCTSHPDRLIECFCSNCEIMCCLMCAVIDHKGHDFKKLDDAAGLKIEELESLMTKVKKVSEKLKTAKSDCEVYVTGVLEDKEKSLAEINKSYEAIANLLRKRQFSLLREVEERSERLVTIAKKNACLYDESLAEIQSTQTYFSNAKSMTDEVGILQMFPSLKSTLCHISSHHSGDFEKFTQKIVFQTVEEENVQKYISRYGDVKEVKVEGQGWFVKPKSDKIQYDRDFLLRLQYSNHSMMIPDSLKRIHLPEIIPDNFKDSHNFLPDFTSGQSQREIFQQHSATGMKAFGGPAERQVFGGSASLQRFGGPMKTQGFGGFSKWPEFGAPTKTNAYKVTPNMHGFGGPSEIQAFGGSSNMQGFGGPTKKEVSRGTPNMHGFVGPTNTNAFGVTPNMQGFGGPSEIQAFGGYSNMQRFGVSTKNEECGGSPNIHGFGSPTKTKHFGVFSHRQRFGGCTEIEIPGSGTLNEGVPFE